MSRHRPGKSYGHRINRIWRGAYRIEWAIDRYYRSSRLRHPIGFSRVTDLDGAKRFARKWKLLEPIGDQENAADG